ncbi:MAG: DeoR/GlpR transcriptional regulator [Clostridia bacterium]|nr:DeoR/GlpR transcriptional regulator [Clostridia bacterium]
MIQYQRQDEILQLLEEQPTMSVKKLAKLLYTSEATVRRDLNSLERMGLVHRIYGGVVLAKYANSDMPLFVRKQENAGEKEKIAARAAALIPEGSSVILDASSTTQHMVRYLTGYKSLTVITNGLKIAEGFAESAVKVLCTGGHYLPENASFVGYQAEEMVKGIRADYFFFSSQGLTEDGEISDHSEEETALRRVMLQRAAQRIFLCDGSKLGRKCLYNVCHAADLQNIICDQPLPQKILDHIK